MKVLVMVAVAAEVHALLGATPRRPVALGPVEGFTASLAIGEVVVVSGGVGTAACAASTAAALAHGEFDLVMSAGIAGGFPGVQVASVVVGTRSVAADLGCQTPEVFLSLSDMGLGMDAYDVPDRWTHVVADRVRRAGLPVVLGDIASVSTITGTAAAADTHARRTGAVAEAMEGFAVATAAALYDVPFIEVRTISNAVGPRDVTTWRTADALVALGDAVRAVTAEPWPW